MAESVQRILVRRALSGRHPKDAQQVIDWLENGSGLEQASQAFCVNGKRRWWRERAHLRRLGGSGAAVLQVRSPESPRH